MCEQCSAKTKTYGLLLPGWTLIQATQDGNKMKKDDYGLVRMDDPDFIFPGNLTPRKDKWRHLEPEDMTQEQSDEDDLFIDYTYELSKYLQGDIYAGYWLLKSSYEIGYDEEKNGYFTGWLSNKMFELIELNPTADENISKEIRESRSLKWGFDR